MIGMGYIGFSSMYFLVAEFNAAKSLYAPNNSCLRKFVKHKHHI